MHLQMTPQVHRRSCFWTPVLLWGSPHYFSPLHLNRVLALRSPYSSTQALIREYHLRLSAWVLNRRSTCSRLFIFNGNGRAGFKRST